MKGVDFMYHYYRPYPCQRWGDRPREHPHWGHPHWLRDYGPHPFVINIEEAAKRNDYFRLALWTGTYYQLTLMSIDVGSDIGLEVHHDVDQFLRIEQGHGLVMMGNRRDNLTFQRRVSDGYVIFVPAGTWHNLINIGPVPIKLYSIYAPPEHPHGTVHRTKEEAEMEHGY